MDFISKRSGYLVRDNWVIVVLDVSSLEWRGTPWH